MNVINQSLCAAFALLSLVFFIPNANALIYNISPAVNFTSSTVAAPNGLGSFSGSFELNGSTLQNVSLTTSDNVGFLIYFAATYASGTYNTNTNVATFGANDAVLSLTFNGLGGNIISASEFQTGTICTIFCFTNSGTRSVTGLNIAPVAVPEPSTYVTMAGVLAIAGLAVVKRRKALV